MTAKHVTVEGLAAALHGADIGCKYHHYAPDGKSCDEKDALGVRHDLMAEGLLAALPDDCPAEADAAALARMVKEYHDWYCLNGHVIEDCYCEAARLYNAHDRRVQGGE